MLEAIVVGLLILSGLLYGCWQIVGGSGSAENESKLSEIIDGNFRSGTTCERSNAVFSDALTNHVTHMERTNPQNIFSSENGREAQKESVKEVDSHHSRMNHWYSVDDDTKMMQTFRENPSRDV